MAKLTTLVETLLHKKLKHRLVQCTPEFSWSLLTDQTILTPHGVMILYVVRCGLRNSPIPCNVLVLLTCIQKFILIFIKNFFVLSVTFYLLNVFLIVKMPEKEEHNSKESTGLFVFTNTPTSAFFTRELALFPYN